MKEALFYEKLINEKVRCLLCPHYCLIQAGNTGICKVRENRKGILLTHVYNNIAAIHTDPIEKKPLFHFYPGKNIVSIGEVGCNFSCSFCQNSSISQCQPENFHKFLDYTPKQVIEHALNTDNNIGIAYTYNEPFTFYEYMYDCSVLTSEKGLKNVVVSNGYVNPEPLEKILTFIDAFNIDLKAFDDEFYSKQTKGSLSPVLETLKTIALAKKHLEITFLAITGVNDNTEEFQRMVGWIADNLGENIPLHISRYFPAFKMINPPTPVSTLENFYDVAKRYLKHVFLGNILDEKRSATYCPACGKTLIRRDHYSIKTKIHLKGSLCGYCSAETGIVI
jgi:pyruvate formate lyase activating enzyme